MHSLVRQPAAVSRSCLPATQIFSGPHVAHLPAEAPLWRVGKGTLLCRLPPAPYPPPLHRTPEHMHCVADPLTPLPPLSSPAMCCRPCCKWRPAHCPPHHPPPMLQLVALACLLLWRRHPRCHPARVGSPCPPRVCPLSPVPPLHLVMLAQPVVSLRAWRHPLPLLAVLVVL
jgi:hypothetical protein